MASIYNPMTKSGLCRFAFIALLGLTGCSKSPAEVLAGMLRASPPHLEPQVQSSKDLLEQRSRSYFSDPSATITRFGGLSSDFLPAQNCALAKTKFGPFFIEEDADGNVSAIGPDNQVFWGLVSQCSLSHFASNSVVGKPHRMHKLDPPPNANDMQWSLSPPGQEISVSRDGAPTELDWTPLIKIVAGMLLFVVALVVKDIFTHKPLQRVKANSVNSLIEEVKSDFVAAQRDEYPSFLYGVGDQILLLNKDRSKLCIVVIAVKNMRWDISMQSQTKISDILRVELSDTSFSELLESSVVKPAGGVGRAIVGGLIAGPVGAVVGAATAKSVVTTTTTRKIHVRPSQLQITMKDRNCPDINFSTYNKAECSFWLKKIRLAILYSVPSS